MKKVFCKICEKETIYSRQTFAKHHLIREHGLNSRAYYDRFKSDPSDGFCKICSKPTFFRNIDEGYNVFCSNACSHLDEEVSIKKVINRLASERKMYGGKIFLQTQECIDKIKETKRQRYGNDKYCNADKIRKTKKQRYGDGGYCNTDKIRETQFKKYGGYGYQQRQTKKSVLKKFGVDNFFKSKQFREMMERDGKWISLHDLSEYEKYKRDVKKETRKWKKSLFSKWDGLDYYTGEKLITYDNWKKECSNIHVSRNKLQPTIDHKISVVYGFVNEIDPKIIGGIKNLCICSRDTNVRKNYKISYCKNKIRR